MNNCTEAGIISEYAKGTVIAMSKKVLEALTVKYSKVQKGVGKIMGGQILEYEAKDILRRGKVEHLLVFLQEIGTIPGEVKERIMSENV